MDTKKEVKKYLNKYFKEQYLKETDDEYKSLVRLLNKAGRILDGRAWDEVPVTLKQVLNAHHIKMMESRVGGASMCICGNRAGSTHACGEYKELIQQLHNSNRGAEINARVNQLLAERIAKAWAEISELKAKLASAMECVEYYADKGNWHGHELENMWDVYWTGSNADGWDFAVEIKKEIEEMKEQGAE